LDFNDIIDTFIFFIPLVIVYALGIFIAKKLGAPPSKKEIE
jgi:Sec-independent protein secretion pathway component TatC